MVMLKNAPFVQSLIEQKIVSEEEVRDLRLHNNGDDMSLLGQLLKERRADKTTLGKLWGDSLGASYVDLEKTLFQDAIIEKLPEKFARMYGAIPVYQMGDTITVATGKPSDQSIITNIAKITGSPVSTVFALPEEVDDAIEIHYQSPDSIETLTQSISIDNLSGTEVTLEQLRKRGGEKAVQELAKALLLYAIKEGASDIHIEPDETSLRVRLRVDGALQERLKMQKPLQAPLVSCLKIMATLDITEKRKPQDGRINLQLSKKSIDFRFSTIPAIYGEKIVMRVLGQINKDSIPKLEELGFSNHIFSTVKKVSESPNGVFFVTGPTGSGKTTTLFSVLQNLNKPDINIVTVEDPVEYRLPGIYQVQTNAAIDLGFSEALRAFLRQDPDVILIGEIRDVETAKIASQAALTGHLVLASMHTNNAFQAVTRLVEIGVEPFLVAPSIIGVLAQRLVRKICEKCKESYSLTSEERDKHFLCDSGDEVLFYRGRGCAECGNTGYSGRVAIHEAFVLNDEIRELVARNASILDIKKAAYRGGFESMRYDGLKKVLRGLTTIDEIDKATTQEEI